MIRINEILDKVDSYLPPSELGLIQKAYIFSASAHAGQMRLSGKPYLSHPLEVANILADLQLDAPTIAAGLLHDTIEDTSVTQEDLASQFGEDVAKIVEGLTKIRKIQFDSREEAQAENIRKMILAMADDIRVIMVKLADRLHNMRTLEFQKEIKQRLIAQETMEIYAPLANRLGLYLLKIQLEDLSLRFQKPDIFNQIQEGLKQYQAAGQGYIDNVCKLLGDLLEDNSIKGTVSGRIKHAYSIYQKMKSQKLTFDQIYDVIAFRTRVKTVKDCYTVLGLVHSLWKPVPGKFKDYISMPKANMYQSLHTTVIGPEGERIEIQIRTEEMHRLAEYGVAAHWIYKEGPRTRLKEKDADRFSWLRQILDWQGDMKNPREFMASLRFDLFQDEVYVFTPQGQVKELPEGATPVDFAYAVHTEVGNQCSGARINGRLVPLHGPLSNGDVVEIITKPDHHPKSDWLQFVKTAKARTRIKHWMRTEERTRAISLAREVLEKEGRKLGINVVKALKNGEFEPIVREMSLKTVDDLLAAVGYARITPRQLLNQLLPKETHKLDRDKERARENARAREGKKQTSESIRVRGVEDVLVRFAQCCHPVPGDPIVGYISRGRGVTVHTKDCPNVVNMEEERLLDVGWEDSGHQCLPARISLKCKNEQGVLATVASLLAEEGMNIDSGHFRSNIDGNTEILLTVQVCDTGQLYKAIEKLRTLPSVLEVVRKSMD